MTRIPRRLLAVALAATLVATACGDDGGGNDEDAAPTTTAPPDRVVLEESFDDDSNGWIGDDPSVFEGSAVVPSIEDGALLLSGIEDGGNLDMFADETITEGTTLVDQRVEASASTTIPGAIHISCRLDPTATALTAYIATVSSAGFYTVQKVRDGELEGPDLMATTPAEIKEQADQGATPETIDFEPAFDGAAEETHDLALECIGGDDDTPVQITLFDGGEEVLTVQDADDPLVVGTGSVGTASSGVAVVRNGFEPWGTAVTDFTLLELVGREAPEPEESDEPEGVEGGVESILMDCPDDQDDLVDDKGNALPGAEGLDLIKPSFSIEDGVATIYWSQVGGFPAEDGSEATGSSRPLVWALTGATPDGTPIDVAVQYAEGEGYSSGSMSAVDPALGGADGTITITDEGDGDGETLVLEVPLSAPLPSGTTLAFHTEYYPDAEAARVDDLCPNDYEDLIL